MKATRGKERKIKTKEKNRYVKDLLFIIDNFRSDVRVPDTRAKALNKKIFENRM